MEILRESGGYIIIDKIKTENTRKGRRTFFSRDVGVNSSIISFKFFSVSCEARENYEFAVSFFSPCQNWLVIEIPITLLLSGVCSKI
jgi:hypothetical protein